MPLQCGRLTEEVSIHTKPDAVYKPVEMARAIHDIKDDSINARARGIEREDAKCRLVCLLTMLDKGQV
jgi:hypothetical protein